MSVISYLSYHKLNACKFKFFWHKIETVKHFNSESRSHPKLTYMDFNWNTIKILNYILVISMVPKKHLNVFQFLAIHQVQRVCATHPLACVLCAWVATHSSGISHRLGRWVKILKIAAYLRSNNNNYITIKLQSQELIRYLDTMSPLQYIWFSPMSILIKPHIE